MAPVCRCQTLASRGVFTVGFSAEACGPDSEILVIITSLKCEANTPRGLATVSSLTASDSCLNRL